MGSKDAFLKQLLSKSSANIEIEKIPVELEKLKLEYEELSTDDSTERPLYSAISQDFSDIEVSPLLQEKIVGSQDSYLSALITKLNHESWVNQGITEYIDHTDNCPFCKQGLEQDLKNKIKAHIDTTYQAKSVALVEFFSQFKERSIILEKSLKHYLVQASFFNDIDFITSANMLRAAIDKNLSFLEKKAKSPSETVTLTPTTTLIDQLNSKITAENTAIEQFNQKLKNRTNAQSQIKKTFWELIHKKYEAEINGYNTRTKDYKAKKTRQILS